jgi:hypothetical protein
MMCVATVIDTLCAMDESIIMHADKVFRWEGPKRKQTLFGASLGRLVLTDQRLLFLSSGKNDVNAKRLIAGALSPIAGLRTSSTSDLDMSALQAKGGLEVALSDVTMAELKGMFKTMTITYTDASGSEQSSTFAPKNGGMPDGAGWVAEIDKRR